MLINKYKVWEYIKKILIQFIKYLEIFKKINNNNLKFFNL